MTEARGRQSFRAQRGLAKARMTAEGMTAEEAERWLRAWEAASNMDVERHSQDFWERGRHWAVDAYRANQTVSDIEG